jgi:L-ascorbate metabolism protein UlaG (beta-lactamase superfamily)
VIRWSATTPDRGARELIGGDAELGGGARQPSPDTAELVGGAGQPARETGESARVGIHFLGHATTLIEINGIRILTDPFLRSRLGPLERHGPLPDPADLEVDAVVISHGHPDHFDVRSLAALPGRPAIVVPRGLGGVVDREPSMHGHVTEVSVGQSFDVAGLTIRAVPARHWISPRAPRAEPLGYVLDGGACVYFAGDTGRFDGMRALAKRVDIALLPVWTWGPHLGPGHLGPRSAADALCDIAPQAAVPIHWGTLYPRHLHRLWRRALSEPGDRFAAHARRLAPQVNVRVLRPGESTSIVVRSSRR